MPLSVQDAFVAETHRLHEQHMCITEPFAFHFGANVNRLEQPHMSMSMSSVGRHLEIQGLVSFFRL